jgi:hypothetical protein
MDGRDVRIAGESSRDKPSASARDESSIRDFETKTDGQGDSIRENEEVFHLQDAKNSKSNRR